MLVLSLGWIVFFGELRHSPGNATNQELDRPCSEARTWLSVHCVCIGPRTHHGFGLSPTGTPTSLGNTNSIELDKRGLSGPSNSACIVYIPGRRRSILNCLESDQSKYFPKSRGSKREAPEKESQHRGSAAPRNRLSRADHRRGTPNVDVVGHSTPQE